jgi:hypothetical protein
VPSTRTRRPAYRLPTIANTGTALGQWTNQEVVTSTR